MNLRCYLVLVMNNEIKIANPTPATGLMPYELKADRKGAR